MPSVSGRSANMDAQAMEVARSNSMDRAGDQPRCPASDLGGLGLLLIVFGAWRRTPCGVSTNDGVLRWSPEPAVVRQIEQWQCMKGTSESDSSVKRTARQWREPFSCIGSPSGT